MAGLKLYPNELENQCNDMIRALENNKDIFPEIEANIEAFVTNESLSGFAWEKMKMQMENHQAAIRTLILAEEKFISECRTLSASLGSEILIEDDLLEQIRNLEAANNCLEATCGLYESMMNYSAHLSTDAVSGIRSTITNTYNMMARNSHTIIVLKEKLERLYYIESTTQSLFSGLDEDLQLVNRIVVGLGKAWQVESGKFYPVILPDHQIKKINDKWTKAYITAAGEAGVVLDRSRAETLMELGYTPDKIKYMMSCCENRSDSLFLQHMLQGEYVEAFGICPFKQWDKNGEPGLSESTKVFMAEFAIKLFEEGVEKSNEKKPLLELSQGTEMNEASPFGELQTFTQAIYTDKYLSPFPDLYASGENNRRDSFTSEYLKYLYAGTDVNLNARANLLRSQDFKKSRLEQLTNTQYANMIMEGYWASQSQVYDANSSQYNVPVVKVGYLEHSNRNHAVSLKLDYFYVNNKYESHYIKSDALEIPSDMVDAHFSEDMSELRQEAEELENSILLDEASNVGLAMLSIIAPEAGVPLSALKTITTGTFSKKGLTVYDGIKNAYGLDNKADATVGHSLTILERFFNYDRTMKDIKLKEKKLQDDYIDDKFGSGVEINVDGNTKIVARGIIDPKEAYLFGRWEREGIRAFVDIDEKMLDEIESGIDDAMYDPTLRISLDMTKKMKVLLWGGGPGSLEQISKETHSNLCKVMRQCLQVDSFSISDAYANKLKDL